MTALYWLPPPPATWKERLKALSKAGADDRWPDAIALSKFDLNFQATNALASVLAQLPPPVAPAGAPERLAILSSSTTSHLHAGLRVAALRRGIALEIYECAYGQYRQELLDKTSPLHAFRPTNILFALDASHVSADIDPQTPDGGADAFVAGLGELWRIARADLGCGILQQTIMNRHPELLGSNEHRFAASPASFTRAVNARLREHADAARVDLVALDSRVAQDGLAAWHSVAFWLKAKQEISLTAAPLYGELVARVLAARKGQAAKCCVFDLDNTLWGGVIGDDGLHGIVVGQGSALGEAHLALQAYGRALSQRGIILAVCSKNDDAVAREAFRSLPDMLLKEEDFGCFVANWNDKASNLREIARTLNIGVDSLVFVDDNPFERELIRKELPMVAVPELPEAIELAPQCLADAGYFESVGITDEDLARKSYYRADRRGAVPAGSTDLRDYLADLQMELVWGDVGPLNLTRVTQLINKTNQFNVTTNRYSEQQVTALMQDRDAICLQFRLVDRLCDNGIIAIVLGRAGSDDTIEIDTWLMSCRVLGRGVEQATLNALVDRARRRGARTLFGIFRPTAKNAMVADLYQRLGFTCVDESEAATTSRLDLQQFQPFDTPITMREASA